MSLAHLVYYWTYAVLGNINTLKCLPSEFEIRILEQMCSGSGSGREWGMAFGQFMWLLEALNNWLLGKDSSLCEHGRDFFVYWETWGTPFFSPIRRKKHGTAGRSTFYPVHVAIRACPRACSLSKQSCLQMDSAFKDFPVNCTSLFHLWPPFLV